VQKRKVKKITVTWDNGESDEYDVDATFSESINSRKKAGYKNLQEWVEYHITWITYIQDLPPVEEPIQKQDRETLRGKAWCSQHNCEPHDCFAQHNPSTAYSGRHPQWDDIEAIRRKQLPKVFSRPEPVNFDKFFEDLMEGHGNGQH
jgi:hypothetical protein